MSGRRSRSPAIRTYEASGRKTFRSALCHLLTTEFPGVFGPAIAGLLADRIDELYARFNPPTTRFRAGQMLWAAVAVDDPPGRDKRIEDTRLVPVVLDIVTSQDIQDATIPKHAKKTRCNKVVRICRQAYAQGGVLSLADIALMLSMNMTTISSAILEHERISGEMVPRRGTIHDMGRSVTHKAIICFKHVVEKKPTSQVASETFHSPEEVEYYVQCFKRVELCRDNGMSKEDIALATGHSLLLVQEYLALIDEFGIPPMANPGEKG